MIYDSKKPVAVFLGPSLERPQASRILTANYYQPARMGDIYRLIGSGVRIIVLIDGLFHGVASVWQRELLEAMENNILVIGASSMGALRAAELSPFGMCGIGLIFEWYRDGVVTGDDEVALHHGDEYSGFRHFSEPLVNIRYNLMQAVEHGYLSKTHFGELIAYAKSTFYGARSYDLLFNSPIVKKWRKERRDRFIQFIHQNALDLKKLDASHALQYCSEAIKSGKRQIISTSSLKAANWSWNQWSSSATYSSQVSCLNRGFLHSTSNLVRGETMLDEVTKDADQITSLGPLLARRYFLLLWAKQRGVECPRSYLDAFKRKWKKDYVQSSWRQWLTTNGLTDQEFQIAIAQRAILQWIVEKEPRDFGIEFNLYARMVEALCSQNLPLMPEENNKTIGNFDRCAESLIRAKEISYLVAWAKENGIACPSSELKKFIDWWERRQHIKNRVRWLHSTKIPRSTYLTLLADLALYSWLLERGPNYFGYASWSLKIALTRELQVTGLAACYVEKINAELVESCP